MPLSGRKYNQNKHHLTLSRQHLLEEAQRKHQGSWALYHSDPEASAALRREALALEDEAKEIEQALLTIKVNPERIPELKEHVPFKVRLKNWLRKWI
jgi:hypothetical protein